MSDPVGWTPILVWLLGDAVLVLVFLVFPEPRKTLGDLFSVGIFGLIFSWVAVATYLAIRIAESPLWGRPISEREVDPYLSAAWDEVNRIAPNSEDA